MKPLMSKHLIALALLASCSALRIHHTLIRIPSTPQHDRQSTLNRACDRARMRGARKLQPLSAVQYEPSPLDPCVVYSQLVVLGASISAFSFWWFVTVPSRRKELALEKRNKSPGSLGNYLDDLRDETSEMGDPSTSEDDASAVGADASTSKPSRRSRGFEQWLLSDWLKKGSQKKQRAVPFLPKAKFNSGDNPILVASALIFGTGVVFSVLGWT